MNLINKAMVRGQFELVGADMQSLLCQEVAKDFSLWSQRLTSAWEAGDEPSVVAARHALKGLCGSFGADRLLVLSSGPLASPEIRTDFLECASQTVAAIKDLAARTG